MALSDNLLAYWALDEASGTRYDSHGSYDLYEYNTVGSTTGLISTAANFVAANSEKLSCAISGFDGPSKATLAFWCRRASSSDHITVGFNGSNAAFRVFVHTDGKIYTYGQNGANNYEYTSYTIANDTWYHLVLLYDGSEAVFNDRLKLAVNGTILSHGGSGSGYPPASLASASSMGDFVIGSFPSIGYSNGYVDEVGLWNRCLSSSEVTDLYNSGSGRNYAYVSGGSGVTGTATQTLPSLIQSASGTSRITGTATQSFPLFVQAANGTPRITATSDQLLPSLVQAAVGGGFVQGTATQTLPLLSQSASGHTVITGTGSQSLPRLLQAGVGSVRLQGDVVSVLPSLTQYATNDDGGGPSYYSCRLSLSISLEV